MHAIKVGWVGQTFALATSKDSGAKKSRIRRSKEERKTMVESFIKKYQESNNGNFPSLNLTHKEVGGSFYTVREIVREVIQENRVLCPPKLFSEECSSEFLEYPLASIALDHQNNLSLSDKMHPVTHAVYGQNQLTSGDHISSIRLQFHGPGPKEMNNKQIINGLTGADEKDGGFEKPSLRHSATGHCQVDSCSGRDDVLHYTEPLPQAMCVDVQIDNGSETFEKNKECETHILVNNDPIHQDTTYETSVLANGIFPGAGSRKPTDEQTVAENSQMKGGARELEALEAVISPKKVEVVVEKFPLRPVSKSIHDMGEKRSKLSDVTGALEEKAKHEMFTESSCALINGKADEKLQSSESSDLSTTTNATMLDVSIVKDVKAKDSLPDEMKASDSPKQSILKESTAVPRKPYLQDRNSFQKESNPMLDRINLETWQGASKKSSVLDHNPLLTLLKGFISAFVRFWTE